MSELERHTDDSSLEEVAAMLVRSLDRVSENVLGLPCFCDTPELHSDECAAVRALCSRATFLAKQREDVAERLATAFEDRMRRYKSVLPPRVELIQLAQRVLR